LTSAPGRASSRARRRESKQGLAIDLEPGNQLARRGANGKIYIGQDRTDSINYFGSAFERAHRGGLPSLGPTDLIDPARLHLKFRSAPSCWWDANNRHEIVVAGRAS
jgi:hypothetical protein